MKRLFGALCCLMLAGTTSPSTQRPDKATLRVSCEASLAFIKDFVDRNRRKTLVFTSEDDGPYIGGLAGLHWVGHLSGDRRVSEPPRTLLKRLERQGELNSVSRCAEIRAFLDSRSIAYGPHAVGRAQKLSKDFKYDAQVVSVSLAIVGNASQTALLSSSSVSAPLAAAGAIYQLDHDSASKWHVTKSAILWIS